MVFQLLLAIWNGLKYVADKKYSILNNKNYNNQNS